MVCNHGEKMGCQEDIVAPAKLECISKKRPGALAALGEGGGERTSLCAAV